MGNINTFRIIKSYYDKNSNKEIKKLYEKSRDNFNLTLIRKSHHYNNFNKKIKKNLINKNLSFIMNPYEDIINNNVSNIINKNILYNNSINELKHNKSDIVLIGNTCIKINKIKKEINNFNNSDNNNNLINNNTYSKLFELSQCLYPLSEERKQNIYKNDINENYQNLKIKKMINNNLRNFSDPKNKTKDNFINKNYEKEFCFKKIKGNTLNINRFLNEKKIRNNDKTNLTLPENKKNINIINISQINKKELTNKKKVIQLKDLLSEIIKDYYKEMKLKGILSLFSKRNTNKYFSRKIPFKYNNEKKLENNNSININKNLPKIKIKSFSQDKNISCKTFIEK